MMAEHHAAEENRHISNFEYELLHRAAEALEDARSQPASQNDGEDG
jgi:hypothetical protein